VVSTWDHHVDYQPAAQPVRRTAKPHFLPRELHRKMQKGGSSEVSAHTRAQPKVPPLARRYGGPAQDFQDRFVTLRYEMRTHYAPEIISVFASRTCAGSIAFRRQRPWRSKCLHWFKNPATLLGLL